MSDIRARQGVEHLQAAAVEVIAALRAFLDVAEAVVRDPSTAASLAASLVETVRPAGCEATPTQPRLTRIRVS